MVHARIVEDPLEPEGVRARVGAEEDGAVLLFLGVVRNHADGRAVEGLRYDAYLEMAREVLEAIAQEAHEILGTGRVAVEHRVGALTVGEPSVAIAVSSPHRAEAYEASRYVIEEIKKRLPIWKKEHFTGGYEAWAEGTEPPGTGRSPDPAVTATGEGS